MDHANTGTLFTERNTRMSIEKQAIAALKWTSIAKILGQTITWVIMLMVLRLLAPEDYGLMAISTVIMLIVASVAELGMGPALIQAPTLGRDELQKIAGVAIGLNLAMGLLVVLAAPLAAAAFGDDRLTLDHPRVGPAVSAQCALHRPAGPGAPRHELQVARMDRSCCRDSLPVFAPLRWPGSGRACGHWCWAVWPEADCERSCCCSAANRCARSFD